MPKSRIRGDPSNGRGAKPAQIRGFLNPRVCLGRAVHPESPCRLATPWSLTLHGALAARAARKHTTFAMFPPLTKMPPQVGS